jgi:hypothetical protein
MMLARSTGSVMLSVFATVVLINGGCSKSLQTGAKPAGQSAVVADVPEHGEWWCGGHGVPEEECAQCDKSLVEKFKAKGDWCKEHDRPESQCFLCDASRFDKFAARYEAKYGKKPPMPKD